jgi:hypothetical protein
VYDKKKDEYAHASGFVIFTPEGKAARYLYGVEFSPRDTRLALIEAASNTIGNPVDQLLLYCYHYDPLTGKQGHQNVLRLAALPLPPGRFHGRHVPSGPPQRRRGWGGPLRPCGHR